MLITNYAMFHEIKTKYVKKVGLFNAEVNKKIEIAKTKFKNAWEGKIIKQNMFKGARTMIKVNSCKHCLIRNLKTIKNKFKNVYITEKSKENKG